MHYRKNEARLEKMQEKVDAGPVAARFPEVERIVISMTYNQKGTRGLLRTFNFVPSSYAVFRVDCLSKECVDGGFDLTQVITAMVRNRKKAAKGELSCEGNAPVSGHADIVYEVAIQYT